MPTRCQDCNSHFLLDATTVVNGISCPDCGGTRLERDQPSPTHSDGELRDMVDPATQLDQGGNPLQEGIWAGVDGGWQPAHKRDEFFASTHSAVEHPLTGEEMHEPDGGWDAWGGEQPYDPGVGPCPYCGSGNTYSKVIDPSGSPWVSNGCKDCFATWSGQRDTPVTSPGHPDPWMDNEPGSLTVPGHWGKTAGIRGPFDMAYGEPYPLPSGGLGQSYKCPNCGGQMNESDGECYRCGYTYGGDTGRGQLNLVDQHREFPFTMEDYMGRVPKDLGPARQGATKVAINLPPMSGIEPQHHQVVQPGERWLHWNPLTYLAFLDAHINGRPVRDLEHYENLGYTSMNPSHPEFGKPVTLSVHDPDHMAAAVQLVQCDDLTGGGEVLAEKAPLMNELGNRILSGEAPAPPGIKPRPQPQPVQTPMSSHSRSLSMEPYIPWHYADVQRFPADDRANPVTMTNEDWAADKRQRYLDRQGLGHRLNWKPGGQGRGIMIGSNLHTWPVNKTAGNPQGGLMHGDYVNSLGINPANINFRTGFEIEPDGKMIGTNIPWEAMQIDPNLHEGQDWGDMFTGSTKTSWAFAAPLIAAGGRMLLSRGLGGLMSRAIAGAGNFLMPGQPGQEEMPAPGPRPVSLVASEHTAVGVAAPVETLHSTPDLIEDHDPEAVDQSEFNDQSDDSNLENPNNDNADGGMSMSQGEDGMHQKLEFRHDGDAISQAELLLPLILEFINSEKSGMEHPQLKALHEALDAEIPGYLDHADPNDEAVEELLDALRKGHESSIRLGVGVYQNTPMNPNQMAMGPQQQQMPMPGTHQNPVQNGGMPVSGKCMNCGGVVNADGSCPQCGASPGANQMGNMEQPNQQTPIGIMPSPYAHTAADHQGPITPQQKEVFAEYLIEQGRQDEVAAMMANPGLYADEWATYLNRQTQPPEVDPSETPPQPQIPPEQMGQMPMPGMQAPAPMMAKVAGPIEYQPPERNLRELNRQMMQKNHPCRACGWRTVIDADQCPRCGAVPEQNIPTRLDMRDPRARTSADNIAQRCPKCDSATTGMLNEDGDCRCSRCGHIWKMKDTVSEYPSVKSNWVIKSYQDALGDAPNPVAAPAAEITDPGDREQQQDSTLSWQDTAGSPLQVGQVYEMHSSFSPIPDVVKVQGVKPDGVVLTMEGEYNAPSDPQDANGPDYTHEIDLNEAQAQNLTFTPMGEGSDAEQSQDQAEQDGVGQTVNTEPVEQPHDSFPVHTHVEGNFVRMAPMSEYDQYFGGESGAAAKAKSSMIQQYGQKKGEEVFYATVNKKKGAVEEIPTDKCPNCEYGHITSNYTSPETLRHECYRCAYAWETEDKDEGANIAPESRTWLRENSSSDDIGFDPAVLARAQGGQGRSLKDIAARDPRNREIHERLEQNKTAGAKFSPREQKEFIDEEGTARNADLLNLDGTHYVSAFDNSSARPERVNDNYLGLGL